MKTPARPGRSRYPQQVPLMTHLVCPVSAVSGDKQRSLFRRGVAARGARRLAQAGRQRLLVMSPNGLFG